MLECIQRSKLRYREVGGVLEGFTVVIMLQVTVTILAAKVHKFWFNVPNITMIMLAAVVGGICGIIYLALRLNVRPVVLRSSEVVTDSSYGIFVIYLFHYIVSITLTRDTTPLDVLDVADIFKIVNIVIFVVLGPVTEEIIYRGVFEEALLPLGNRYAILLPSALFVTSHLISRSYGSLSGTALIAGYLFLLSSVAGCVYKRSGLVSACLVHSFNNAYVVLTNL